MKIEISMPQGSVRGTQLFMDQTAVAVARSQAPSASEWATPELAKWESSPLHHILSSGAAHSDAEGAYERTTATAVLSINTGSGEPLTP